MILAGARGASRTREDLQYGLESTAAKLRTTYPAGGVAQLRLVLSRPGLGGLNLGDCYKQAPTHPAPLAIRCELAPDRPARRGAIARVVRSTGVDRGRRAAPKRNLIGMPWRSRFRRLQAGMDPANAWSGIKPNAIARSVPRPAVQPH